MPDRTLDSPMILHRAASNAPASIDEQNRTAELIAATTTPVPRFDWDGRFNEVLEISEEAVDLDRLATGRSPLLDGHATHSMKSVLGVVEAAWIDGDQLRARVRFGDDEEGERAFRNVKAGLWGNVSVGYRIEAVREEKSEDGERIITATRWQPFEVSLVPIAADVNSHVRAQETPAVPPPAAGNRGTPAERPDPENRDEAEARASEARASALNRAALAAEAAGMSIRDFASMVANTPADAIGDLAGRIVDEREEAPEQRRSDTPDHEPGWLARMVRERYDPGDDLDTRGLAALRTRARLEQENAPVEPGERGWLAQQVRRQFADDTDNVRKLDDYRDPAPGEPGFVAAMMRRRFEKSGDQD